MSEMSIEMREIYAKRRGKLEFLISRLSVDLYCVDDEDDIRNARLAIDDALGLPQLSELEIDLKAVLHDILTNIESRGDAYRETPEEVPA